jgi:ribose transport system permease protein
VVAAAAGAFTLEALFTLLTIAGVPSTYRSAIQGFIIILAVAYSATTFQARTRQRAVESSPDQGKEPAGDDRSAETERVSVSGGTVDDNEEEPR